MSQSTKAAPTEKAAVHAMIYTRVSSAAQVQKGHGAESQETRCREFARMKGYDVLEVFSDKGVSGSLINRPGMQAMLNAISEASLDQNIAVLIDDISRLARDIKAHLDLRQAISAAGATLESPSFEFGEDSDSVLVENLLASVSQHQRQNNAEQTKNRMRARMQNGYYTFYAPLGLKYETVAGRGKILVRDEPVASVIQEAIEGFAHGRFRSQAEVARFLEQQPAFPKTRHGTVTNEAANRILNRVVYAGMIECPYWGITRREGQHDGLVSAATWNKAQERLNGHSYAPMRKDLDADFPLRGAILCGDCGHPYTACWSKSKTGKRYAYYLCHHQPCISYRKSIRRDDLEGAFEDLLVSIEPSPTLVKLAGVIFKDLWDQRLAQAGSAAGTLKAQLKKLDDQIESLLDRIVAATTGSVVSAYEKRIAKLESEKLSVSEKLAMTGKPQRPFTEMFELALEFLSNPLNLWENDDLRSRRTVARLCFEGPLTYDRNQGLRTPPIALPFRLLGQMSRKESQMAEEAVTSNCSLMTRRCLTGKQLGTLPFSGMKSASAGLQPSDSNVFWPNSLLGRTGNYSAHMRESSHGRRTRTARV